MSQKSPLSNDQLDFLECLNDNKANYLIIGGHAVSILSQPRATKDIDIWIGEDKKNRKKVVEALIAFGAPSLMVEALKTAKSNEFLRMGVPPNCIDILQRIPGVKDFSKAFEQRMEVELGDFNVYVIGIEALISAKKAAGRKQDLADVEALEKALQFTKHKK